MNLLPLFTSTGNMKNVLLVFVLLTSTFLLHAQGADCASMDPICTQDGVSYPASTNTTAEAGNDYDCLGSVPNPAWYYFEIATNGNIDMELNGNGQDIDFIIWGPFNDLATAQGNCGSLTAGQVVDCSYSGTTVESPSIPGASVGDVYIMLITNFSNNPTQIDLTQTGGTGSTDCSIVTPCNITNFTVNVGACNPATNTFDLSGTVEFTDWPTTGQMIVQDCNGNQDVFNINGGFSSPVNYNINGIPADGAACDITVSFTDDPGCTQTIAYTNPADCTPPCFLNYIDVVVGACDPADNNFDLTGEIQFTNQPTTGQLIVQDCNGNQQVFNAPFTSPIFYTIADVPSDGTTNCSVTATFTADPLCTITTPLYDNPTGCQCNAEAGTYSTGTIGNTNSTGPFDLCFGDQLDLTANGDYTAPDDYTGVIAATYDPGIWLLAYSCPPSVFPPNDIIGPLPNPPYEDPCLLGIASTADAAWSIVNNVGDGSSVWFVPVTMYSMVDGIYAISINGGNWCYALGPAVEVTFLEDITTNVVEDCQAGTATVTVSGGQPANDGSNFTASNLLPASAAFGNTTAANGGTITVTGLQDGDNYSFDISDGTDCIATVTGTFVGTEDPAFTYPAAAYCQDEADPSPVITGVPGGTFTAPAGVSINPATGVIDLSASTAGGPYTITYTTPDPVCFSQATFDITINPLPIVDGNDVTICPGDMVTLSGTGADTYVWSGGVVDNTAFPGPATTTTYTVTGTVTATGCTNTGDAVVTVNPLDDASFTTTDFCEGTASPTANVTGTPGGTFAYSPDPGDGSSVNGASGAITNGVGGTTYTIEYTTSGACPQTSTQTITVNPLPNVDVPDYSVCTGGTVALTATGATNYTWAPGTDLNTTTGATVNSTPAADITYTVTGTDGNGCQNTDVTTVTVIPNAPIDAGPDVTICDGESTTLTASGGVTYTWQAPISANGASQTVSPATTTTYTVDGVDAAGCTGTDQVTVTVNPLPTATIAGTITVCEGDAAPTITFTGANGTAPYTFTYNINGGANQTVTSVGNTATVTAPTGVTGTFDYNLVDVMDASATICNQALAEVATVTVNPLPTATIAGTIDVCEGDPSPTITFTGANGTAPYTFTYNINGGANVTVTSVGNTATVTVPTGTAGTYDYNLVSVQDASATGCSQAQVGTATVVVNPLPTATIAGTIDVCIGGVAVITFTGANGTAPYTFTYNINGGANQTIVSVGNTATINAPTGTAGVFDYNLVSVQDASSTACSQAQPGTATVTVNPTPSATIAGDVTVCVGDAAPTITFTGANGTAPYTFTYSINGGANQTVVSTGNTATVTAPTGVAGTFVYNLSNVSDASVTACSQALNEDVTIIVNPLPTAIISGTVSVCEGEPDPTITFTGANGTAPYTFTYNINGGANQTITSVGNIATITVPSTPVGTYNYNLVSVQDASATGCSQAQPGTATVTVNPNPVPVINGATDYCAGTFATLSTTVAYNTYAWSTGDATPTTDVTIADNPITVTVSNAFGCTATSAVFTVVENSVINYNSTVTICQGDVAVIHGNNESVAGVYSQTFVLPTGCDSTSNVTLVVNPLPVIDAGLDQAVCFGDPVTVNAVGAPTIVWDNGVTNGAPFPFQQPVGTVTYTATGTDANGCVNTDVVDITINPLPTASIAGTVTVCQNDAGPTITFTGANGTAPYTFTYNINGGANQTVTSVGNTATVTAPTGTVGVFDYNLVSVMDASATTCSQAQAGTATITVNPLPTATIAGTIDVCVGDVDPTITFTGANGTAPYTFTYTINGGANQTVTSVGNTATVTAPTGVAGTFDYDLVSVVDASATNCSQAQVGTATVTVNPLPTATIAGTIDVCVGDAAPTITFTGANGTAPYTFTYTINGGANLTVVSVGNTATVTAPTGTAGTFVYDLVSVEDGSSTNCSQAQVGSATVIVNPLPTATIAGSTDVCVGDPAPMITFTGANGTAPYTFTYTINGGPDQTVISVGNTATVTAPTGVDGTFDYDLVSVQDASSTTCSQAQAGTATIIVNPLPTGAVAGTITVCEGDVDPVITFTGGNGTAPYTFTYNINGGVNMTIVSVGNTATVSAPTNVPGTFNYNLVGVQDASSTMCSQAVVDVATVIVNPSPTATIDGDATICFGDQAPVVTFTGANGTAPYTFTYTLDGSANQTVVSTGNTATVTSPAGPGTFVYELVSVQDASATACSQAQTGTVTIVVNDLPIVFAGNDFIVCEGDQAVLTGSGAVNYDWDNNVTNGTPFTPGSTQIYTVTGTDANGCQGTDDVEVTVEPLPVVSFTDPASGCAPLTATFYNTTPGNLSNCIWTFSNGVTVNSCDSATVTFENGGLYDATLTTTSVNGCTNSMTYPDYIQVEDLPVASFSVSSSEVSTFNTEVSFDNTSTGASTYAWDFGDESAGSSEFEPLHTFPDDGDGTYVIELIAYSELFGCTDTAYQTVSVKEEVIFYVPNTFTPDDDDFNETFKPVFTSGYDPFDYTLLIFNRWGEIIWESHDVSVGWDGTYAGVHEVQDGTFTWRIEFKTLQNDERVRVTGHVNILR